MEMPVLEHLGELRKRLLRVLLFVFLLTLASFAGAESFLGWLLKPSPLAEGGALASLSPASVFVQSLRLSFLLGIVLALPVILFHLWGFVSPGLKSPEKRLLLSALYGGTLLFFLGVLFAYYYVVPKALAFFWDYSRYLGVQPVWTIEAYLQFVLIFLMAFGLAFELPVLLLVLIRLGLVRREGLKAKRPHIIVGIAVLAALLTPPDVISQICLAIPLWFLFEISLFLAKWLEK